MLHRKVILLIALSFIATVALASPIPRTISPRSAANPPPFDNFRAPVSGTVDTYLRVAQSLPSTLPASGSQVPLATSVSNYPTTVFNNDPSPFSQNEETVATNVTATGTITIVGGYNDYRGILALLNPSAQAGFSGFSITNNAGANQPPVTDGDLPRVLLPLTSSATLSGGDPAIDVAGTGTFYYSSLYYNFSTSKFFDCPKKSPCESAVVVFPSVQSSSLATCRGIACWGSPKVVVDSTFTLSPFGGVFNDKDWVAVDRATGSGVYVTYTAFSFGPQFQSTINMVRCTLDLSTCSSPVVISGSDILTQGSFVAVRTDGSIAVAYVSYDTFPFRIRGVQCAPGTGVAFTCPAPSTIASVNVDLFSLVTEGFRVPTLPQMAVDYSSTLNRNRVVVVWAACANHYVQGATFTIIVCPQGFVAAAYIDGRTTMAGPWTLLNVTSSTSNAFFPTVSIDAKDGNVSIAYFSTDNDRPWNHRLDLMVSYFSTTTVTRVTAISDEPSDDPLLRDFFFGDYIQSTASAGTLYLSYTGNYAAKGNPPVFQQDNYLSTIPD